LFGQHTAPFEIVCVPHVHALVAASPIVQAVGCGFDACPQTASQLKLGAYGFTGGVEGVYAVEPHAFGACGEMVGFVARALPLASQQHCTPQ
jgi:hypothetical protein